jgi:type IV secretory pathway VirB2 component (pilin)
LYAYVFIYICRASEKLKASMSKAEIVEEDIQSVVVLLTGPKAAGIYIYICMYVCMYMHKYVCMIVYILVNICIYMYIYI